MAKVGIVANPASGKDIRRLVAHGTVFDNIEKTNIVERILLGLAATGLEQVMIMPDTYGIGQRALEKLGGSDKLGLEVEFLDMAIGYGPDDSTEAARRMREAGAGCIVVLGGDGTNRAVAKTCGDVPLLPISTGTNNVFPYMMEGTTAGLAAGVTAMGAAREILKTKRLNIYRGGQYLDLALIDAVVSTDLFVGSRALWDMSRIKQVVSTRGEAHNIGMSAVGGCFHPITPQMDEGLHVEIGNGRYRVRAPIAPGMVLDIGVKSVETLKLGQRVTVGYKPSTLALDGEREHRIGPEDDLEIELVREGPFVVDVQGTMGKAAEHRFFGG